MKEVPFPKDREDEPNALLDKVCCARILSQHCFHCPHRSQKGASCAFGLYKDLRRQAMVEAGIYPDEPKKIAWDIARRRFRTDSWMPADRRVVRFLNKQLNPLHRLLFG